MTKVRVVKAFRDKHTQEMHKRGSIFECSEERLAEILDKGAYVEVIPDEPTDEPEDEPTDEPERGAEDPLEHLGIAELRERAQSMKINVGSLRKKTDIIAAIRATE